MVKTKTPRTRQSIYTDTGYKDLKGYQGNHCTQFRERKERAQHHLQSILRQDREDLKPLRKIIAQLTYRIRQCNSGGRNRDELV